jgi:hypothetical protein
LRAAPARIRLLDEAQPRPEQLERRLQIGGVGRPVVDDDHLEIE